MARRGMGWRGKAMIAALRARVAQLEAALQWYAADGENAEFRIVDRNGEFVADFSSFSSRAIAALKDAPQ